MADKKYKRRVRSKSKSLYETAPPCELCRSRNWTELPEDVTASILSRLGAIEILRSAEMVCTTWRKICKDPLTWRTIDMRNPFGFSYKDATLEKMCRHAIDRSSANLLDISVGYFATADLLKYIAHSSSGIRRLRLVHCNFQVDEVLSEVAWKLPLLEELEISLCQLSVSSHKCLQVIGRYCPLLKSFKLNNKIHWNRNDEDALAIAGTMRGLCHLQLVGNSLNNGGLSKILDCCSHLQSLDLRRCFNLDLDGDLGGRCAVLIKKLRFPRDSTNDFVIATSDYCYRTSRRYSYDYDYLYDFDIFDYYEYEFDFYDVKKLEASYFWLN